MAETLEDLLQRLNIKTWDLLLVGDGSGSRWEQPAGWACVAIERSRQQLGRANDSGGGEQLRRKVFYGAVNDGTVNFAELMAYFAPLSWYAAKTEKFDGPLVLPREVHILTDSQYVQKMMTGRMPKTHAAFWLAYNIYNRLGFRLNWHWLPRNDIALNRYVDAISRKARLLLQNPGSVLI